MVNLPSPFALDPGHYWLSIQANLDFPLTTASGVGRRGTSPLTNRPRSAIQATDSAPAARRGGTQSTRAGRNLGQTSCSDCSARGRRSALHSRRDRFMWIRGAVPFCSMQGGSKGAEVQLGS